MSARKADVRREDDAPALGARGRGPGAAGPLDGGPARGEKGLRGRAEQPRGRAASAPAHPPLRSSLPALFLALLLAGCGVYSFSGTSIPDRLRTVAVPIAENRAAGGPATLDQQLTEALVTRFADRSRLSLVTDEAEADAVVRAVIERYSIAPVAVTGDNVAALNRVSLSVRVVVEDRVGEGGAAAGQGGPPGELLARTFTGTSEFDPATGFAGEADAAAEAIDQIASDAFTAATSDW